MRRPKDTNPAGGRLDRFKSRLTGAFSSKRADSSPGPTISVNSGLAEPTDQESLVAEGENLLNEQLTERLSDSNEAIADSIAAETADVETAEEAQPGETLWQTAFALARERDADLMAAFDKHLSDILHDLELVSDANESDAAIHILSDKDKIKEVVAELVTRRKNKQWRFRFVSKDIEIRESVEALATILQKSDGLIKQIASLNPYASLAWSGVSMFLPVSS